MIYDLVIIGGGPAATAAGVYAARKKLETLVIAKEFAGQSTVSPEIYNWIGEKAISGEQLAKNLADHLKSYEGQSLTIEEGRAATAVSRAEDNTFTVTNDANTTHQGRTVLVATGAGRRKLVAKGADEFEHKGLTYCATCDGPLFTEQDVVVIGGGNAGFESAAQLLAYVKSVTLLEHNEHFAADAVTTEKVLAHEHMTAHTNTEVTEVVGETMVTGLRYRDRTSGEEHQLDVTGVFVEIGVEPNTALVADLVDLDPYRRIRVDPRRQRASLEGIWAAGDCTDALYAQNNIAAGDAIKAVEDIYVHLRA